jgi:hypothetical protein
VTTISKGRLQTNMVGRRVQMHKTIKFAMEHPTYLNYESKAGEIVNAYLSGGCPAYDVLFDDGAIIQRIWSCSFTVVGEKT